MNSLNIKLFKDYVLVKREIKQPKSGIILPDNAKDSAEARWVVEDQGPKVPEALQGHEIIFKTMCEFYRIDEEHTVLSFDNIIAMKL